MNRRFFLALSLPVSCFALSACDPASDYQGVQPDAFQTANPKVNLVEQHFAAHDMRFGTRADRLSPPELTNLKVFLSGVEPMSASGVKIHMPHEYDTRARHLVRELRKRGYASTQISLHISPELAADTARIEVHYTTVTTPRCPDWRKVSQHNYSNTNHSDFGCSTVTNLGRMVADPADLVRGKGGATMDATLSVQAIEAYRNPESGAQSDNLPPSAIGN